MKRKKIIALIASGLMTCSILTACTTTAVPNTTAPTVAETKTTASTSQFANSSTNAVSTPAANTTSGDIGITKASEIAMENAKVDASRASITKQKMDYEDGLPVYDIEFIVNGIKYQYEIGTADGSIRKASQKAVEQGMTPVDGQVSPEAAMAVALSQAHLAENQVTITKQKLDYDDGRAEYEVEFVAKGVEYEYSIDAVTGTILSAETEMN